MERLNKITHISQLLPEQLQEPVKFDEVELTPEETELAISSAKVQKHDMLERQRKQRLSEVKRKKFSEDLSNPNNLYSLARWRATQAIRMRTGDPTVEFEPTEFQKPVITALSLYFSGKPEFEQLDTRLYNNQPTKFSLNKGIWMWGNPGVGKTLMMEMFNRNSRLCYEVIHCPKLAYEYVKQGDEAIERFGKIIPAIQSSTNFGQKVMGVCYNDLGVETVPSKHYGNPINVLETITLQAYENKVPYWHRFVTTNLVFDQVKEVYGLRFIDRIKECFNIIEVRGESLRK